jgi:hypothetical protein
MSGEKNNYQAQWRISRGLGKIPTSACSKIFSFFLLTTSNLIMYSPFERGAATLQVATVCVNRFDVVVYAI